MISCIKFWNDYDKCRQAKNFFIKCEKKYDMLEKCWLGYWCLTILLYLRYMVPVTFFWWRENHRNTANY
jgi:hypothetical protein